jgi:galactokinase
LSLSGPPAFRLVRGSTHGLPDAEIFLQFLENFQDQPPWLLGLFDPYVNTFVARAPGRLDVMGGIADYSGSLVLQMPIQPAALVAVQLDASKIIQIVSLENSENGRGTAKFEMMLKDFEHAGSPVDYETARANFQRQPAQSWAAYIAGTFLVLMRERGMEFTGARILVDSHVPEGKGVSSSAAIEVATMQAVCAASGAHLKPSDLALLCQKVENLVVGAPCGVMDQMTSACGEQGRFLELLCQPADIRGTVPIPDEIEFWGVDSGMRHSVSGSDYSSVRIGAFMGYRILADLAGFPIQQSEEDGHMNVADSRWHGYLANLSPTEFEQYRANIPEHMTGRDFLAQYGGTTDRVTRVEAERTYAVRQPTAHPVYENARVRTFAELLAAPSGEQQLQSLGELMSQSHASYSACGLGSEGTDLLVNLTRTIGPERGLYGAKITGGGSGGTVAILAKKNSGAAVAEVVDAYRGTTGHKPFVFSQSSPGAGAFGFLQLVPR